MSNDPNGEFLKAQPHGGGFDFDKREPGNPHGGDFDKPGNLIIYTNNTERIRVEPNGDVFVEGRKAGTDEEVFRGLQRVFGPASHSLDELILIRSLANVIVAYDNVSGQQWPDGGEVPVDALDAAHVAEARKLLALVLPVKTSSTSSPRRR